MNVSINFEQFYLTAVSIKYGDLQIAHYHGFAAFGDAAELLQNQAPKRREFLVAELCPEVVIEFVDRGECLYDVIGFVEFLYMIIVIHIEFVLDFSDDLLQYILYCYCATDTTIFINYDGHMLSRFTEFFEQDVQSLAFRYEGRGAQNVFDVKSVMDASQ